MGFAAHERRPPLLATGAALLLGLAAGACTGTPQPDPPNERPVFHIERTSVELPPPSAGPPTIIYGMPGALTPLGATALAFALFDTEPPTSIVPDVTTDTFVVELRGDGTRFRFGPRLGDLRGDPVDATLELRGGFTLTERELPCLRLDPPLEVGVHRGDTATVRIDNTCPDAVAIAAVNVRTDGSPFAIANAPAGSIAPDGSGVIEISLGGDAELTSEEIVLLDLGSPTETTLHFTVYALP